MEIKEGIDYLTNAIQLKFDIQKMREEAEPFKYKVEKVTEDSITLSWNNVSKIKDFIIYAEDYKNGDITVKEKLENNVTEYTIKGLNPDHIHSFYFESNYFYDLKSEYEFKIKTNDENAKATKI